MRSILVVADSSPMSLLVHSSAHMQLFLNTPRVAAARNPDTHLNCNNGKAALQVKQCLAVWDASVPYLDGRWLCLYTLHIHASSRRNGGLLSYPLRDYC